MYTTRSGPRSIAANSAGRSRRRALCCVLACCALMVCACNQHSFVLRRAEAVGDFEDVTVRQRFFFGGAFQERRVRAADICGGADNVVWVRSVTDWPTALLTALTFAIYNPSTATVRCARSAVAPLGS